MHATSVKHYWHLSSSLQMFCFVTIAISWHISYTYWGIWVYTIVLLEWCLGVMVVHQNVVHTSTFRFDSASTSSKIFHSILPSFIGLINHLASFSWLAFGLAGRINTSAKLKPHAIHCKISSFRSIIMNWLPDCLLTYILLLWCGKSYILRASNEGF